MDPRLTGLDLKTSLSAIADMVLPRVCVVCGRPLLLQEKHICLCCLADMPETCFAAQSHNPMADRFNSAISLFSGLVREDVRYEPYAYAAALFYYSSDNGYANITRALKYRRDFGAGKFFAAMLGERLSGSARFSDVDAVVPVPLHWTRRWKRGYNQAEVIAVQVARRLGCACMPGLLRRVHRTRTQTRLSGEDKRRNVAGAFAVSRHPRSIPRHILLVDDVFTSGSTLAACHAALREVFGPQTRISAATLGFVGEE